MPISFNSLDNFFEYFTIVLVHTSDFWLYLRSSQISGAITKGVPILVLARSKVSLMSLEMPKSPIFISLEAVMKMLSALRSRCRIFLSWMYLRPSASWMNHYNTCPYPKGRPSARRTYKYFYRSPRSAYSITMHTVFSFTKDYRYRTT